MPDGVRLPGVGVVAQELRTAAPPMLASFWVSGKLFTSLRSSIRAALI